MEFYGTIPITALSKKLRRSKSALYDGAYRFGAGRHHRVTRFPIGPTAAEYNAKLQQECELWGVDLAKRARCSRAVVFVRAKTFQHFLKAGHTKKGISRAACVDHTTVMHSVDFLSVWTDERFNSWIPVRKRPRRRSQKFKKITHAALIDNYGKFRINRGQRHHVAAAK